MINYKIRQLEDNLVDLINKSDVPIECKRLIVQDILKKITAQADNVIVEEIKEMKQEEE